MGAAASASAKTPRHTNWAGSTVSDRVQETAASSKRQRRRGGHQRQEHKLGTQDSCVRWVGVRGHAGQKGA